MDAQPPLVPGLRILHRIGAGGQGSVHVAVDAEGRRVAVKYLPLPEDNRDAARQRFLQEACLLRALKHPNLVEVLDYGCTDAACYLVMELLVGRTLAQHVHGDGTAPSIATPDAVTRPLPPRPDTEAGGDTAAATNTRARDDWRWIVDVGIEVCRGLAKLHVASVWHRDVKPANVVITEDGRVVLVDLGLATAPDLPRDPEGDGGGTHGYMSREQRLGVSLSNRSDVYSLGCTLHACLLGHPPADDVAMPARREMIQRANPSLPPTLVALLARCLETDPLSRYATADDLRLDLEAVRAGRPLGWRRPVRTRTWPLWGGVLAALWPAYCLLRPPTMAELAANRDVARLSARLREDPVDASAVLQDAFVDMAHDGETVRTLAAAIGWCAIPIAPSPRHLVHVDACADLDRIPPAPALAQFLSARQAQTVAVPPGFVVIRVHEEDRSWGDDAAPVVFQLLREARAEAPVTIDPEALPSSERSLVALGAVQWRIVAPGRYQVRVDAGEKPARKTVELRQPLAVAHIECTTSCVAVYCSWVEQDPARRQHLFAHPLEPPDAMTDMDRDLGRVDEPALTSYWLAFRVAGFFAARLPTRLEWSLVVQAAYGDGVPALETWLARARDQSASVHDPDAYPDTLGLHHLLDGAREWTADIAVQEAPRHGWAPVGYVPTTNTIVRNASPDVVSLFDQLSLGPTKRAGFRLFRDVLRR